MVPSRPWPCLPHMAFTRPSRNHTHGSALRALYHGYVWGYHLGENSQCLIPGGYILGRFSGPQLQALLPLVPTEDSGSSPHPPGMRLTEPPGPSLHTAPHWPPHTRLSRALQNTEGRHPQWNSSVRLSAGAEEVWGGVAACPAHSYLRLHQPRVAVLLTPSSHPGPRCH